MKLEAILQNKGVMRDGDIEVEINFYFPNRRMDIDNCLKGLLDCLSGVLWKDDRQIVSLRARKLLDKINPRVELTIK